MKHYILVYCNPPDPEEHRLLVHVGHWIRRHQLVPTLAITDLRQSSLLHECIRATLNGCRVKSTRVAQIGLGTDARIERVFRHDWSADCILIFVDQFPESVRGLLQKKGIRLFSAIVRRDRRGVLTLTGWLNKAGAEKQQPPDNLLSGSDSELDATLEFALPNDLPFSNEL